MLEKQIKQLQYIYMEPSEKAPLLLKWASENAELMVL